MSIVLQIVQGDTLHTPSYYDILIQTGPMFSSQDASKYGWAGVLTQPYKEINKSTESTAEGGASQKKTVIHHPVSYISRLFRGSQLNWAALTKEAYSIYISVRKLNFYLTNADVLIRSDHLPLKEVLETEHYEH